MDTATYNGRAAAAFKRLLAALDRVDPDELEADSTGDMVTISAPRTGEKCIVNTQRAVHQLWVAGKGQGVHFDYDEASGRWLDDKGRGLELFAHVADVLESLVGRRLPL
jgi:CyaY protein